MKYIKYTVVILAICTSVLAQNLRGGGEANFHLRTNEASLKKWRTLRFGMFIHWGPVSLRGTEIGWSRGREIPYEEYDQLYREFNPVLFSADQWVRIAKDAGMKYLILVTKHHDGFTLWDSEYTDYDIMASPFSRDIVKELSDACARQGLLFGTYYSILDWYHPDYPLKKNREVWKEQHNMDRYVTFVKRQVRELVEKYSTKVLWFDGEWEEPWTHQMGMDLYAFVRGLDDEILVNNRVDKGRKGMEGVSQSDKFAGDFATPEQRVGRFDPLTPWESCITICKQWAWKSNDELKSKKECIQTLVKTAGGDGNLLLNVGPMMDGRIEKRQIDRLMEIGDWLQEYGETIYGTRGGPVPPQAWGVTTQTDEKIYVHILEIAGGDVLLPDLKDKIRTARLFNDKIPIDFRQNKNKLVLKIPDAHANDIDLVIELIKENTLNK